MTPSMTSDGELLLTDLCAICHNNPLKYTCPKCGIHTCSLACVKRHKTWAQCSGVRDPAAYRKRADLATESSIDQDFNFITKVERSLTRADSDALEKGIYPALSHLNFRNYNNRPTFDIEVEKRKITLVRAPQGLSRNKQNKSHWIGQQRCIMWTVEWLLQDGERRTSNVPETTSIGDAFLRAFGKKAARKKRKRHAQDNRTEVTQKPATPENSDYGFASKPPQEPMNTPNLEQIADADGKTQTKTKEDNAEETSRDVNDDFEGKHFYLHRPQTTSKLKCLVPLSQDTILLDALTGRTVLEYPTIYVRMEPPEQLIEPFLSEDKYNTIYGSDIPIDLPLCKKSETTGSQAISALKEIDERRVLEVLEKDIQS